MNPLLSQSSGRPPSPPRPIPQVLPVELEAPPPIPFAVPVEPPAPPPIPVVRAVPVASYPAPAQQYTLVDYAFWTADAIYWSFVWVLGFISLMGGLAILAAIPLAQFLALGYLLEAGGRVARTGKLRNGLPGVWKAARVGGMFMGVFLWMLPLWLLSDLAVSAQLIDPDGPIAFRWRFGLVAATVLVVLHLAAAIARGGNLRYFFWPLNALWLWKQVMRGGYYGRARDAAYDFVVALRLPFYFWLGLRGFIGGLAWLVVPVAMLAIGGPLAWLGGLLLSIVLLYLPFLQIRFAAQNRFRALFEVGAIRADFKRAPWCFLIALLITLAFAIPLYLLKIEMIPREIAWLPSLVFMVFIYPARVLTGWAVGIAEHRTRRSNWFFRWTGFLPMPALTVFYVFLLFFTQYAAWNGARSLFEQHAFLVPVPFMGM